MSDGNVTIEVCCFNLESALIAAAAGAHRIELCHERHLDGHTPHRDATMRVIAAYDEKLSSKELPAVPLIHVMVRPRPSMAMEQGGAAVFVLTDEEKAQCYADIAWLGALRCNGRHAVHGVVIGALRYLSHDENQLEIDWDFVTKAVGATRSAGIEDVTFHRCFDFVGDWNAPKTIAESLDALSSVGISRVLTSGTVEAAPLQKRMDRLITSARMSVAASSSNLCIMPAGGINRTAVLAFLEAQKGGQCLITEFHGSFLSSMHHDVPDVGAIVEAISL